VDAVVVGSGTARADDPELTARRRDTVIHRPIRVLVDSVLRVSTRIRLFSDFPETTWVVYGRGAPASRRRAVERTGARLLEVPTLSGRVDLAAALRRLAREGLTQILVEGGGELAAAFLRRRMIDEVHWFLAPRLLGGDGRPALGALELRSLATAPWLEGDLGRREGDVYIRGAVHYPARGQPKRKR
jgi:diaminohydroxyphosphoribosylaminopyrimidine deaminase/5-amino-6-(5-phosphoribosylamino)uracil reductase